MRNFLIALVFIATPLPALAVVVPSLTETVSIEATPAYQIPNENVVFRARASGGKGSYTYVWAVNGKQVTAGVDLDKVTLPSGNAGSITTITVALVDQAGAIRGAGHYVVRPAEVDIVWEGRTSVPPFYKGKSYPNGESTIVLEAIPHFIDQGEFIPKGNLVYLWDIAGKKADAQSGYGRYSIEISPPVFKKSFVVTVTAQTREGSFAAQSSTVVTIVTPKIVVYEEKPLFGVWFNRAIVGVSLFPGEEITFRAFPFFSSNPDALSYAWSLDGTPFELKNTKPGEATFRKTGAGSGTFSVEVNATGAGSRFEGGENSFRLSF